MHTIVNKLICTYTGLNNGSVKLTSEQSL